MVASNSKIDINEDESPDIHQERELVLVGIKLRWLLVGIKLGLIFIIVKLGVAN